MQRDDLTSRWRPVVAYAALSATNQMLWLTFAPITTATATHYGVSEGAVGWLAELFPLVYVVLALPTGRLLDRSLPRWLAVGAVLTALGALVRLGADGYGAQLAGQILVAVAQPLVLNAVTSMSARHLRPADRATGIAVSSAGVFAGMLLALVLGAAIGGDHVRVLLVVQAALAVGAAGWLCVELRGPAAAARPAEPVALRTVWADVPIRVLVGLACVGFGVFVALTTWLQTLLDPAGVSEGAAGGLLVVMVVAGIAGAAVVPAWAARTGRRAAFVLASIVLGAAGLVVLGLAPGLGAGIPVLAVLGFLLLADLPIVLELAERRAGPAGGTASALVWLAGNAAGLVVALAVQVLVHHPGWAFVLMAVVLVLGAPLIPALRRIGLEPDATQPAAQGV